MPHLNNTQGCTHAATPSCHRAPVRGVSHTGRRFRQRLLVCLIGGALAAGAVALPTTAWAQSVDARLQGSAPANTKIIAFNTATGVTHHIQSSASGSYVLPGLPPGTYTVRADHAPPRTITLQVASTVTINFKKAKPVTVVPASTPTNTTKLKGVEVTAGVMPVIKTSQVATVVSQHQIATLPQVSRNFLEFADIVPGMKFTVGANGNTSLRGGALTHSAVNVYIDGVSRKNYVFNSAVSGQNASQGNPFPEAAISQYKVITGGFKAQYSQLGSAVITALTKSGTNQFHGGAFERYTNSGYRAQTPAENHAGKKTNSSEREFGFSMGGPIIKNKMHFFVTYSGKRFNTPTAVQAGSNALPGVPFLPSDIAAQFGPANLPFKENQYFAKLDWEPTSNDRFVLTGSFRFGHGIKDVGGVTAASAGVDNDHINRRYMFKWDHTSNSGAFNELTLTHQYSFFHPTPLELGNGKVYTWDVGTQNDTIISTGPATPLALQDKGQKGFTLRDNFTFAPLTWLGTHVIEVGASFRDLTLVAQDAGNENPQFYYDVTPSDGFSASLPSKAFFTKPVTGLGLTPRVVTKDYQYGLFAEDDWSVTDKLTLNLGIRWDYERDPTYTSFVTPANVVAAFGQPITAPGVTPAVTFREAAAAGGPGVAYNIDDYISNGRDRSDFKGEFQPRLGFSYDLFDNKKHVIHGAMGRSYDRNLYDYMQLETTKAALPEFTVYFRNPKTGMCLRGQPPCFDWNPDLLKGLSHLQALVTATNEGGEVDLLSNNMKPPYTDKFSLGMRNQVGIWLTNATVVRTFNKRGFAFTRGNRYPDGSFYGPNGAQFSSPTIPGFGALIIGQNGIEINSTQVLVSAKKPFTMQSGWGATISYTHTHAMTNRDVTQHYSFDYPFVTDYPFITSNAAPEDRIVASGSVRLPWGLILGAKLELATPTPEDFIACFPAAQVTFANGSHCQAVSGKPKGSEFLFGHIWGYRDFDFQLTKNFHLPYGGTLYARFDVLNAFNFRNYVGYINDVSGGPGNIQVAYNKIGDITFVPRTIKFTMGVRF